MGNMRTLHSTTMCRLLGYATANENISLREVLGAQSTDAFRELSEIHNDGWGTAMVKEPDQTAHVTDGGAPSPSTGSAIYRNTIAARYDSIFGDLASVPVRGGIWHLRLASSNLPLVLENQQPFYASGLSFIHNGDISDAQGRNITTNRAYPVTTRSCSPRVDVRIPRSTSPLCCSTSVMATNSRRRSLRRCANCGAHTRIPATTA